MNILRGHSGYVFCLKYYKGKLVSGGADSTIRIWNLENSTCQVLFGHESCVVCVNYNGDKIISGSTDTRIRVWDAKSGACLYSLAQHSATVGAPVEIQGERPSFANEPCY